MDAAPTPSRTVRTVCAVRTLRTVQKKGGLGGFLLGTDDRNLQPIALRLKNKIRRKLSSR